MRTEQSGLSRLADLSARLFVPVRTLFGPLHRTRRVPRFRPGVRQTADQRPADAWWASQAVWFPQDHPPRRHNQLSHLVHGDAYFAELFDAMQNAREYMYIAGWCLTPFFPLKRGDRAETEATEFARVLADVSQRVDVRILIWAGAPFLFEPTTSRVEADRVRVKAAAPRVRYELDRRAHFSHCHHQKAVVVDGQLAFVGGMDITSFQGDRWDTVTHPPRWGPNWHDAMLKIEGEAVADVEENFRQRWADVTGERDLPHREPRYESSWHLPLQVVRTVPPGFYAFAPQGIAGIKHAYLHAIAGARRYIYLENQYLWDPDIVDALEAAMNRPHDGLFRIVIVLPAKAYTGKYDNDQHVERLRRADGGRGIFEAYALYTGGMSGSAAGFRYMPIYVHAKVGIVDDAWLTVGSANLNRRGLGNDTEMNVHALAPDHARDLRIALWSEHLEVSEDELSAADPIALVDGLWKERAHEMERALADLIDLPRGRVIRYQTGRMPGDALLDECEDLTLEI